MECLQYSAEREKQGEEIDVEERMEGAGGCWRLEETNKLEREVGEATVSGIIKKTVMPSLVRDYS